MSIIHTVLFKLKFSEEGSSGVKWRQFRSIGVKCIQVIANGVQCGQVSSAWVGQKFEAKNHATQAKILAQFYLQTRLPGAVPQPLF